MQAASAGPARAAASAKDSRFGRSFGAATAAMAADSDRSAPPARRGGRRESPVQVLEVPRSDTPSGCAQIPWQQLNTHRVMGSGDAVWLDYSC